MFLQKSVVYGMTSRPIFCSLGRGRSGPPTLYQLYCCCLEQYQGRQDRGGSWTKFAHLVQGVMWVCELKSIHWLTCSAHLSFVFIFRERYLFYGIFQQGFCYQGYFNKITMVLLWGVEGRQGRMEMGRQVGFLLDKKPVITYEVRHGHTMVMSWVDLNAWQSDPPASYYMTCCGVIRNRPFSRLD